MQKLAGLMIFSMLSCAACVSVAQLPERVIIQAPPPQGVQSVVLRPTVMNPGTIKNVDLQTDAAQFFSRSLKNALEAKQPDWQIGMADEQGVIPDGDLTITTELISIDGGSAGLRFWIGFGAGAAESIVKVSVLDRAGKELASAKIAERTMCPVGACVELNQATVRRNLQSLAGEAADFIISPAKYEKKKASEP